MSKNLGSVGFFTTYRPAQRLDLFTPYTPPFHLRIPKSDTCLTDGKSYNYNGRIIRRGALKRMLKRQLLSSIGTTVDDVELGLLFVSERGNGLETLYIALKIHSIEDPLIFSFADVYDTYDGVRMEDSPVIAGPYLVYVTTKDPSPFRRQPWTAVYRTHLETGETQRLTPLYTADLNPAATRDRAGSMLAVASFQEKEGGWRGEIENLTTDIFVMSVEDPSDRKPLIKNGGWPTWGSKKVLFFHSKVINMDNPPDPSKDYWAVFRAALNDDGSVREILQMTPEGFHAFTPAAINEDLVVVAIIRENSTTMAKRTSGQYRQIEIFDKNKGPNDSVPITWQSTDHYNPFVIYHRGGNSTDETRIGYHRANFDDEGNEAQVEAQQLMDIESPVSDVGLFRVSGVFPTFSRDGSKLAFVDNEFSAVWVTDSTGPLRKVYDTKKTDGVFSPVWNQDPDKDILYFCKGPSFQADKEVDIMAIFNASSVHHHHNRDARIIVKNGHNNAFPSGSPDGTRLVYRSAFTEDGGSNYYKNLFIREQSDSQEEFSLIELPIRRLTTGDWTDTHCDWSPNGKWIVFSSSRDKPADATENTFGLDPSYFAIYLVAVDNKDVVIRVMQSGPDLGGHVNHPFFSPDGCSIVISSDVAAVSCDPISLPQFIHSVRPYGDIFTIDIDPDHIEMNEGITTFHRMTHSKFENSTCTWSIYSTDDSRGAWNLILNQPHILQCPYIHSDGSEGWQMTGHLIIPERQC